jgi:hypothetical protein
MRYQGYTSQHRYIHTYVYTRYRHTCTYITIDTYIYRMSQEECARFREVVPYVKVYRYNPKHLCPKLNVYGDNGKRKVWPSCGSTHCTCQLTNLSFPSLSVVSYNAIQQEISNCTWDSYLPQGDM